MADSSLNVIALISGGKDSFYSLLHCLQHGHRVIALGNLYPAPTSSNQDSSNQPSSQHKNEAEEPDLNSFMYQTVGHTVIPLYERALGIPLYRQEINGTAVQTGRSYGYSEAENDDDETESLVPLLKRILKEHPEANALSTGAILSTYQRTRIESVAVRLGLTPLAYLWQYPILAPGTQSSLLYDMQAIGLDARIVKVASGGLDESFLWQNVASEKIIGRLERAMSRFGVEGDGATIGEGGEFETLVVDGPRWLFKGRIVVQEVDLKVVREGGGSAWLKILKADVIMKDHEEAEMNQCRVPRLLEPRFQEVLDGPSKLDGNAFPKQNARNGLEKYTIGLYKSTLVEQKDIRHLMFTSSPDNQSMGIEETANKAIECIRQHLSQSSLEPTDIIFTLIILRSMQDFAAVNKIYGALFTHPNPPSRVTISCGDLLPANADLLIQTRTLNSQNKSKSREALHVQSRSYWAPANIGPYSQAISVPLSSNDESESFGTFIAGQIPLVPYTMTLPNSKGNDGYFMEEFKLQVVLSLQHLWRVSREMRVGWFTSGVAYLPRCTDTEHNTIQHQALIASLVWEALHEHPSTDTEDDLDIPVDLWETKHYAGKASIGASKSERALPDFDLVIDRSPTLPNISRLDLAGKERTLSTVPPIFVVEVEELPRGSMVEWHAHAGVVGGSVALFCSEDIEIQDEGDRWRVYQCVVDDSVAYSVVMIPWNEESGRRIDTLEKVMSLLDEKTGSAHTAYVDHKATEISVSERCGMVIPCRSIWDMAGNERLAAVLMFETLLR